MSKAKNTHCPKFCTASNSKSLERWALEARECNLDYGTYRRLIESGKTYAELRARAKDHGLQPHATRGHWLSRN